MKTQEVKNQKLLTLLEEREKVFEAEKCKNQIF